MSALLGDTLYVLGGWDGYDCLSSIEKADLLDGANSDFYLDFTNATNKPDPTITLSGDVTGSVTLTDLASGTITTDIAASGVTAAQYGGATEIPIITIAADGRITPWLYYVTFPKIEKISS